MRILDYMYRIGYEQLLVCSNAEVGLKAIIAIPDTTLGPASLG